MSQFELSLEARAGPNHGDVSWTSMRLRVQMRSLGEQDGDLLRGDQINDSLRI